MKYKHSVIIGKFMPPHMGHSYMIESALAYSEKVTVLVYFTGGEPIPGEPRYEALKEHFRKQKRVKIKLVIKPEGFPQQPSDHEDFWNIWKKEIQSRASDIDCFFGSETYVKSLGDLFGCSHHIVDIERGTVNCSGTACRNNPREEWLNIIPEFRKHYVKKICFVGGESTGKSTMARTMAKIFSTIHVEEYARELCKIQDPSTFKTEDFEMIAIIQKRNADHELDKANYYAFFDTESIVTQSFHMMYLKESSPVLDELIEEDDYHHYFLLAPTIEWEDDKTREFSKIEERRRHFEIIQELLIKWKKPFTVITETDFNKRVSEIKEIVSKM